MIGEAKTSWARWRDALRACRAGRYGEGHLRLAMRTLRWLRHAQRQDHWLQRVGRSPILGQAASADVRLLDRWQRPYLDRHFDAAARMDAIETHYQHLSRHFPRRMRDRILRGHDVRVAMLQLENATPAYVHLRKPVDGRAGELGIYLLNEFKEALASCVVTFIRPHTLLIGSMEGAWSYMAEDAKREFVRASCGLAPKDLLMSLLRAMADTQSILHIRAVPHAAQAARLRSDDGDAFVRQQGGIPDAAGHYDLPPVDLPEPETGSARRRMLALRREQVRREACARFEQAFGGYPHGRVDMPPVSGVAEASLDMAIMLRASC
jgi:uncharacterized protein VirK/YbjX